MKISTIKSNFVTLVSILFLIIVWEIASSAINSEIILPSPETTLISLISIIKSESFLPVVFATLARWLVAFLAACLAGIVVGLIIGVSVVVDSLIKPLLILIMSTPVISFILLALIWFKTDVVPIFVAFLIIFPIIVFNVSEGIKNVDEKLIQMAQIYKVKKRRVLSEIYFPSIISYLIAGITTAIGIGWKAAITAEVLSQPMYAIGTKLENSKIYLETSNVFAWTLVAVTISFIFEKIIRLAEKKIVRWR